MGENNSKWSNWQTTNLKNIQATPTAQLQKNKWPNQKKRTLTVLKSTGQVFHRLNWDLVDIFFLMIRSMLCVLEIKTIEIKCFFSITSRKYTINTMCDYWPWPGSPGLRSVRQTSLLQSSFSPLHTTLFGRKSLCTAHACEVGICVPPPGGRVSS